MIHVIKPGLLTTVQDMGRPGFAHVGFSTGGAADTVAFRLANLAAGNHANAPALEITLAGPTLQFQHETTIAICGSRTSTSLPVNEPVTLAAGDRLTFGSLLDGARAYVAVRGGVEVPEVMGGCSTFIPAQVGGFHGRALRAGDRLDIGKGAVRQGRKLSGIASGLLQKSGRPLLVTPSLQSDWFDAHAIRLFYEQRFTVTNESNRSGLRLAGESIRATRGDELITEGIPLGAVQVPPDGHPIILFVDQHTTGGYPKIACVAAVDIPRVGQLRPGDEVHFQQTTISEAIELLRRRENALRKAFTE